ncbi:uncharacterized protein Z518_08021 [Rhinocladiella mackenziei CBS 650.93]|uniref:Uncharacterized protein n=1 Tax=Rhinocladiella mackenziei CBS 650.93 TaxID=1442369 RepID=A0A0D2FJH3_9EURO|nr:uncharacterized protein Z518_08021 [Rhinocladiella mackenziei CBS 650.93]KIX02082.1 hypothetical protein Z518_08021 [Rhinocladiella mackenziei CBS 650.93]
MRPPFFLISFLLFCGRGVVGVASRLEKRVFNTGSQDTNELALSKHFCDSIENTLLSSGRGNAVLNGKAVWQGLGINDLLTQYLIDNPAIDDWSGRFYRDEAVLEVQPEGFSCLTENDNCQPKVGCQFYDSTHAMLVSLSLGNLHKILSAQIRAYDRAIEKFDELDQNLARTLFKDTAFGRDRFTFDVAAFFTGFELGISLAFPALGGSLTTAIKEALKTGLQTVRDAAIDAAIDLGDDPTTDGKPFVNSLRATFEPLKQSLRNVLHAYMDTGATDPALVSPPADTVSYLRDGDLVDTILKSDDELVEEAAKEIIKQTAAPVIAGIWNQQGVRMANFPENNCDPTVCKALGGGFCSPLRFLATDFGDPVCLEIGVGFDIPENLGAVLNRFNIGFTQITLNAVRLSLLCHESNSLPRSALGSMLVLGEGWDLST